MAKLQALPTVDYEVLASLFANPDAPAPHGTWRDYPFMTSATLTGLADARIGHDALSSPVDEAAVAAGVADLPRYVQVYRARTRALPRRDSGTDKFSPGTFDGLVTILDRETKTAVCTRWFTAESSASVKLHDVGNTLTDDFAMQFAAAATAAVKDMSRLARR